MKAFHLILAASAVSLLASCSSGPSTTEAAVTLIEGPLAEQSGLVFADAECVAPASDKVGETFTCTATTGDGAVVNFAGVIDPDDVIFVAPSNIIAANEMSVVEAEAAEVLGGELGTTIDPSAVECPEVTTVLVDDQMRCEITDVDSGNRYEMILTATEFELREGFGNRFYEVGEQLN